MRKGPKVTARILQASCMPIMPIGCPMGCPIGWPIVCPIGIQLGCPIGIPEGMLIPMLGTSVNTIRMKVSCYRPAPSELMTMPMLPCMFMFMPIPMHPFGDMHPLCMHPPEAWLTGKVPKLHKLMVFHPMSHLCRQGTISLHGQRGFYSPHYFCSGLRCEVMEGARVGAANSNE